MRNEQEFYNGDNKVQILRIVGNKNQKKNGCCKKGMYYLNIYPLAELQII